MLSEHTQRKETYGRGTVRGHETRAQHEWHLCGVMIPVHNTNADAALVRGHDLRTTRMPMPCVTKADSQNIHENRVNSNFASAHPSPLPRDSQPVPGQVRDENECLQYGLFISPGKRFQYASELMISPPLRVESAWYTDIGPITV